MNNLGGSVVYIDYSQADPLPRTARLGWAIESGLNYRSETVQLNLINITIAREAENFLFKRFNDGSWKYQGIPLGDIAIDKHLIASEASGFVSVRRGFSANILEIVTIRQGSYEGDGNLSYTTSGYSISTRGFSKIVGSNMRQSSEFNPVQFLFSHLEIRFSHSEYTGHPILGGTSFDNIIFSFYR